MARKASTKHLRVGFPGTYASPTSTPTPASESAMVGGGSISGGVAAVSLQALVPEFFRREPPEVSMGRRIFLLPLHDVVLEHRVALGCLAIFSCSHLTQSWAGQAQGLPLPRHPPAPRRQKRPRERAPMGTGPASASAAFPVPTKPPPATANPHDRSVSLGPPARSSQSPGLVSGFPGLHEYGITHFYNNEEETREERREEKNRRVGARALEVPNSVYYMLAAAARCPRDILQTICPCAALPGFGFPPFCTSVHLYPVCTV